MRRTAGRRAVKAIAVILAVIAVLALAAECGSVLLIHSFEPWTPDYSIADISNLLDGRELSEGDYELIFAQTGLTRIGVDDLLASGEGARILDIQESFFDSEGYSYDRFGWLMTSFDKNVGHYAYPELRDGDIVCCFSTFLSFIEIGHCAIVVDGELELLAETADYSATFGIISAREFFKPTAYAVLRPNVPDGVKKEAVRVAMDDIFGTEYDILAGIFEPKARVPLRKTHCSHSVWYAYAMAGVDLDANGGRIVTPRDIFNSPYLDLVSVRGIDISSLGGGK